MSPSAPAAMMNGSRGCLSCSCRLIRLPRRRSLTESTKISASTAGRWFNLGDAGCGEDPENGVCWGSGCCSEPASALNGSSSSTTTRYSSSRRCHRGRPRPKLWPYIAALGAWPGPRCLFVEVNGELRVYNLSEPPVAPNDMDREIKPLEIVRLATDVRVALQRFHRDRFESGRGIRGRRPGPPRLAELTSACFETSARRLRHAPADGSPRTTRTH